MCLSDYGHSTSHYSHCRISWSIFTKIGTDVYKKLQSKNEFVGVNIKAPPLPPFCLFPENPILGQGVLKIHATISNSISALNVRESPKFPRFEEIWVEEGDGDDRVYTGSRNMAVSRMRNENIQYNR